MEHELTVQVSIWQTPNKKTVLGIRAEALEAGEDCGGGGFCTGLQGKMSVYREENGLGFRNSPSAGVPVLPSIRCMNLSPSRASRAWEQRAPWTWPSLALMPAPAHWPAAPQGRLSSVSCSCPRAHLQSPATPRCRSHPWRWPRSPWHCSKSRTFLSFWQLTLSLVFPN